MRQKLNTLIKTIIYLVLFKGGILAIFKKNKDATPYNKTIATRVKYQDASEKIKLDTRSLLYFCIWC